MTDPLAALLSEHRQCGKPYDGCYSHYPMPHCRADGMMWPCDVEQIRVLLAQPTASAEGLVEHDPSGGAEAHGGTRWLSLSDNEMGIASEWFDRGWAARDDRVEGLRERLLAMKRPSYGSAEYIPAAEWNGTIDKVLATLEGANR